jgi:hypothetical protein
MGRNVAVPHVGKLPSLNFILFFEFIVLLDIMWFNFIFVYLLCFAYILICAMHGLLLSVLHVCLCLLILNMCMLTVYMLCICLPIFGEKLYRVYVQFVPKTFWHTSPNNILDKFFSIWLSKFYAIFTRLGHRASRFWCRLYVICICKTYRNKIKLSYSYWFESVEELFC